MNLSIYLYVNILYISIYNIFALSNAKTCYLVIVIVIIISVLKITYLCRLTVKYFIGVVSRRPVINQQACNKLSFIHFPTRCV